MPVPSVLVLDGDDLRRVVLVFVDLSVFVDFPLRLFFILLEIVLHKNVYGVKIERVFQTTFQ